MAALICDTGALIAIERGDRAVGALLATAVEQGTEVLTSSACVAEVWRDPARQARVARALSGMIERSLDPYEARRGGLLMARARTDDITDTAIATLAQDGDTILTSDPNDITHLLGAAGTRARVRKV